MLPVDSYSMICTNLSFSLFRWLIQVTAPSRKEKLCKRFERVSTRSVGMLFVSRSIVLSSDDTL